MSARGNFEPALIDYIDTRAQWDAIWDAAAEHCTDTEMLALIMWCAGHTTYTIAPALELSRQRIEQILKQALAKIKTAITGQRYQSEDMRLKVPAPLYSGTVTHKRCRVCGYDYPASTFWVDARYKDGLDSTCKHCRASKRVGRRGA